MTMSTDLAAAAMHFHRAGDLHRAEQLYAELLDYAPSPEIHNNLGIVKRALGDLQGAIDCYRRAIAVAPGFFEAHNNLGNVLWKRGQLREALECLNRAVEINPAAAMAHCTRGLILIELAELPDAMNAFRQSLALAPKFAEAHNGLGMALQHAGEIVQAAVAYRRAIALKPSLAIAHVNLGNALTGLHRFRDACEHYRRALALNPHERTAEDNLLMAMQYDPQFDMDELSAAHCDWGRRQSERVRPTPLPSVSVDPRRRLRVGYVSPDFRKHSVAYFIEPILANHDAGEVETYCYAEVARPDHTTERLRALAGEWRSTVGMSDDAVAETIRRDRIDILVDLAGHTSGNRLGVFARKPAPVQLCYLGYGNTTGLRTVDYWLTDAVTDPPGEARRHTEELVRLRHGFCCYAPPLDAPEVATPPVLRNGYLTFGSFNKRVKINPSVVRLWSEILTRIPTARLLLKDRAFASREMRELTLAEFAQNGVAAERIELAPRAESMRDHLSLYGRIDVALDPFPYGGSTTTCESLWMGVPVITLRGNCYVGRMTASLLSHVGLRGFIAANEQDYVRRAVALEGAAECLADLRRDLRGLFAASAVCDAAGYVGELESAYRAMWQRYCDGVGACQLGGAVA